MNSLFSLENFKRVFPWILLLGGIALLLIGYLGSFSSESTIKYVLLKIGEISIVSVLFSFLTSCAQFIGVFQKAVEDIVLLEDKYLKKRNDIEHIWIRVSKIMFKSKFSAISQDLLDIIKKSYLPTEAVSYYSTHKRIIDIEWDSEDKTFIKVKEKHSFKAHTINKEEFRFPIFHSISVPDLDEEEYYIRVKKCQVNEQDVDFETRTELKDGVFNANFSLSLKDEDEYKIDIDIEKRYNFDLDYFIGFKAKYMVNNLSVEIFHPDDMDVCFLERGTNHDFKCFNKNKKRNCLEYSYNGLILQKQGYIILLKKKP